MTQPNVSHQTATVSRAPVLAERTSRDGCVWQARVSADRGRLHVVCVVPASDVPTVVEALTESELRQLLHEAPAVQTGAWVCVECGTPNASGRRWCRVCSAHDGGAHV
jgi:hypothetical protein